MKIVIISPGKKHSPELRDAITEFETRLRSALPVEWMFPSPGTREEEGKAIVKAILPTDVVIVLDEHGKDISSPELADVLSDQLQEGTKRLVFVIGGAFGIQDFVKERANYTYRLSSLVFPHMLVRLILIEQLYRAWSIRSGGKYHHA